MARIGFVGLGNMGRPMALNLRKAGHDLVVFDLDASACDILGEAGAEIAPDVVSVVAGVDVLITMLPEGRHVRSVYVDGGLLEAAAPSCLLIDCSTIDVATARETSVTAASRGLELLDAPVSGGVVGAEAASLTFMVGGSEAGFAQARPILGAMGKNVFHAGGAGAGQAAKICNNMLLGISMIGTCEAFALAEKLGLAADRLFEISSTASGQCWSLTTYCPVPGPVPSSPANRDYRPGFTATMMLKDLNLALEAAQRSGAVTPLGGEARRLYDLFCDRGGKALDFSAIIKMLRDQTNS